MTNEWAVATAASKTTDQIAEYLYAPNSEALCHALRAELRKRIAKYREFVEFVKGAPVSSGVCCCGDDMEKHPEPMSCGHTPVDQWTYSLSLWIEELEKME